MFFAFASEIKALRALPDVEAVADKAVCRSYLLLDCQENTTRTFFQNIWRMPPGCEMALDLKALMISPRQYLPAVKPKSYWSLTPTSRRQQITEANVAAKANDFYDLFADAVRLRLRADVKVGAALSGG